MRLVLPFAAACLALSSCAGGPGPAPSATARQGVVETISAYELAGMMEAGKVVLIDVRSPAEFAEMRIAGGLLSPLDTFDPAAIPQEEVRETILYCRSSLRSAQAAEQLAAYTGGRVRHLEGGIAAWEAAGLPVIRAQSSGE